MKFTDGQWLLRSGSAAHYATEARSIIIEDGKLGVLAPVRAIRDRGDTLQGPLLTITLSSPLPDAVRVRIEHFAGGLARGPQIPLRPQARAAVEISDGAESATLTSGNLTARVKKGSWGLTFEARGLALTTSGWRECRLMPYLWSAAIEAYREGVPMMRAMVLEFPDDPACDALDRQYMLGGSLLVAPVFTEDGTVDYYVPAGRWTNLLTGQVQEGPRWHREQHGFLSLPLMVRPGTILPLGAVDDRPDYDYADGVTFRVYELSDGVELACAVSTPERSESARCSVQRAGTRVTADFSGDATAPWRLQLAGIETVAAPSGTRVISDPAGVILQTAEGSRHLDFEL